MSSVAAVSVMFTDLVDSTAILSKLGPDGGEALRRTHFGLLRDVVVRTEGVEVKNLGDGLMVVFHSPSAALRCAGAMQRALQAHNRDATEPLNVRIGVSHGEAELAEGDYFGAPVVEAARLCGRAGGGQVLTTGLVRTLVEQRDDLVFISLGDLELKGIPNPVPGYLFDWTVGPEPTALDERDEGVSPLPPRLDQTWPFSFSGRSAERELLATAFKSAAVEGTRRVVLVSGEPGIGKTRLVAQGAGDVHRAGGYVLYGRCDPDLGTAYQPFVEALGHLIEHAPRKVVAGHIDRHGGELQRLLPGLSRSFPGLPGPQSADPELERHLLFAATCSLLSAASEHAPVMLVLDDLHWADPATLLLLKYVVAESTAARLLIVATFREDELSGDHPLRPLLTDFYREAGVERLTLGGLDDGELLALMEDAAGNPLGPDGEELARTICRETDGNVFFAIEIFRHLAETGAVELIDGKWLLQSNVEIQLPQSVRDVVGLRVARLGERVRQALRTAAVIGREFDLELLAVTDGTDEDELIDLLEAAVGAELLDVVPRAADRFSFAHALIEHTLYEEITPSRRQRIHRRVAEALEQVCGPDPGDRLAELAYHWAEANRAAEQAIAYAERAGLHALTQLAPQEAMRWFERALALMAPADDQQRCRLLIGLGDAQRQAGDAAHRETLLDASRLAEKLGHTDLLVRAVLANSRGIVSAPGERDAERVAMLEAARRRMSDTDSHSLALVLAHLALEVAETDRERSTRLADDATAIARRIGEPATLARVLNLVNGALLAPDTLDLRLATSAESVSLSDDVGDPALRWHAALNRYLAVMEVGDVAEADRHLTVMEDIATRIGQGFYGWYSMFVRVGRMLLTGRLAESEPIADRALDVGTRTGQPDAFLYYGACLFQLRREQGRVAELVELLEQTMEASPGLHVVRAALMVIYCDVQREADAARLFEIDAADGFALLPRDASWIAAVADLGEVAAHLGDVARAALVLELLSPYAGRLVCAGPMCEGPIEFYLGLVTAAIGRIDDAAALFSSAIATCDRIGAPFWRARAMLELAEVTRAGGADPDEWRGVLTDAVAVATDIGAAGIEQRAREMLDESRPAFDQ